MIDINDFISKYVTKRDKSLFLQDIENYYSEIYRKINNKTVLVIGGAGSIGTSFIKAILEFKPASIVVVDINENALTELTRDLRSTKGVYIPKDYITYPMDFNSKIFEKMYRSRNGFDVVCNFSAHKHVRSEKDIYSIEALFQNNVFNAKKLLDLISEYPPEEYFCVSTDKAANPANIMGASKRIMEDVIFSYSDRFPVKTARFANVAFSNGSLLAGFLTRIQKMQPLSAPYDVKRYFVSPEESGQICLLSCVLGNNREIFFPKLNKAQMMSFDVIGTMLLKMLGYEIVRCSSDEEALQKSEELKKGGNIYPVYYSLSNTSGEKGFEEFFTNTESIDIDKYSSVGVITNKTIPKTDRINKLFNDLNIAFEKESSKDIIVQILKDYLPNFEHVETGKCLDDKM